MKNSYNITQSEAGNWLYKADHHYLAARLLFLHSLIFSAEENAAFALELLLKCACKKKEIPFKTNHKLVDLWGTVSPPFTLDDGYREYLEKLEINLYSKHPDRWSGGRKGDDGYDKLDLLYLKLRKWVVEILSEDDRIRTELDLAKDGEQMFKNVIERHGSWSLSEVLKRSNLRYDLL